MANGTYLEEGGLLYHFSLLITPYFFTILYNYLAFTLFISTNKVRMWPNGPPPIVFGTFGPSNNLQKFSKETVPKMENLNNSVNLCFSLLLLNQTQLLDNTYLEIQSLLAINLHLHLLPFL
ncbi:hypothetical protein BB560_004966 [Smittium megazygosporum]|uniref:Uncharacterized protein n=1 Tax=Smittium megazygosporum TaxID=133381 RepID=A0A2T9Z7R9_9FUNG|nr:hypothetical protein BB560_004966 [Smittium megazygosporum]